MTLAQEDLNAINDYVKQHIGQWLAEVTPPAYDPRLLERIVRVEEELRHQRELMEQGFNLMEKRFEEMYKNTNARFEQMERNTNARFEQMERNTNARFEELRQDMNTRFEQMDKRFEQMDKRFEQMDKNTNARFDALTRRIDRFMIWSFGLTVTTAGVIIAVLKLT
jgi:septin family protein